jgi:DNA invertase Pin-like site-specific DNA recombinase
MKIIIYTRVSTKNQDIEMQISKLKEYCKNHNYEIINIFQDVGTGKNIKRNQYQDLLKEIHLRSFDTLLIWKLDRLSRSLKDLLEIGELLNSKNINLISYDGAIDTTSPQGKMMFQMMGIFAEFQRNLIIDNVKAGLDRAKQKGVKLGRPRTADKKYSKEILDNTISMQKQGYSIRKISKLLNLNDSSTLSKKLKEYKNNS